MYTLGEVLQNRVKPNTKLASNSNWPTMLYLSYHLDCKYYGVEKPNNTVAELQKDLQKYDIDYYVLWSPVKRNLSFLAGYQEVTAGRIRGMRIFNLKKRK